MDACEGTEVEMILDEETNREGGRGERGGAEHPGEPAARYARRGTPLLSSLLYTPLPPSAALFSFSLRSLPRDSLLKP